jgi:anti-sigma B factor antagonist
VLSDGSIFQIDVSADAQQAVLHLSGELDVESVEALLKEGQSVVDAGHVHLILDCAGLTFCDSQGLGGMTRLWQLVQPDGSVTVDHASAHLARVLEVTGLAEVLGVVVDAS